MAAIDDRQLLAGLLHQSVAEGQTLLSALLAEAPAISVAHVARPRRVARVFGAAGAALILSGALVASQSGPALAGSTPSPNSGRAVYRSPAVVMVARPTVGLAQAALRTRSAAAVARAMIHRSAAPGLLAQLAAEDAASRDGAAPALAEEGVVLASLTFAPPQQTYPPAAPPPPPPAPPATPELPPVVVIYDGTQGAPPAPPAPPAPVRPSRPSTAFYYTVQRKDNLRLIAKQVYGDERRWPAIYQANRSLLAAPEKIYPGQRLLIPAVGSVAQPAPAKPAPAPPAKPAPAPPAKPAPVKPTGSSYTVQQRDSLRAIAQAYYGDERRWPAIYQANRQLIGANPDRLPAGIKLTIPGAGVAQPAPQPPAPRPAPQPIPLPPAPQPIPLPPANAVTYTVAPGETLSSIALEVYGDSNKWIVLYNANRAAIGPNPDLLAPGTVLVVP